MKLHVNRQDDALYLRLDESQVIESEEMAPGVVLDFNDRNEVVGIEMLHLSRRTTQFDPTSLEVESA